MAKGKNGGKYVVAVKDSSGKEIRPGKELGKFRTEEFADHALHGLVMKENAQQPWSVGIFLNGKLVS